MSEVVTFEHGRRREGYRPGGDANRAKADFFNRNELNQILQVYSRRVISGEWRDYSLAWDERGAVFDIYGAASSVPIYSVTKRARAARRHGGRYQVLTRGRVLTTDMSLDGVLRVLDRRKPRLVDDA